MTEHDAAVNETEDRRPSMEVGGRTVQFPVKLPPGIAAALQMGRVDLAYKILADGDEDVLEHLILNMQEEHFDQVAQLYGLSRPNS